MPEVGSTRADAQRNRERILDAAAAVLGGRANATLLDIAREAGVSTATIYRHFSDLAAIREALLDEVQDLGRELLATHLQTSDDAPFAERLLSMVRIALPIRTRYAKAMATEPVPDANLISSFLPAISALVRQAQARSEVRADLDAEVMADALIVTAFYVARRVYRDGRPIEESVQILETFLRGMAPGRRLN